MLSPKTSRNNGSYGDVKIIYPSVEVDRSPNIGRIMSDPAAEGRFANYATSRTEFFPAIKSREIRNVRLCESHIIYDEDSIYTDNLIAAKFAHSDEIFTNISNGHAQIAASYENNGRNAINVEYPLILTSNEGSGTWGHWLIHNLPKILIAIQYFPSHKIALPREYMYGYFKNFGDMLNLFGVSSDRIFFVDRDEKYKIDTAVLVDFLYTGSVHPYCLEIFDSLVGVGSTVSPKSVFADRITSGKREITNKDIVLERMGSIGFTAISLGSLSVSAQINVWRNGQEFAAVLGSDLTNIVFGRPGSSILAITPAWFGDNFFFDLACARGMIWNELFCGEITVDRGHVSSDFLVDERSLDYFLRGSRYSSCVRRRCLGA